VKPDQRQPGPPTCSVPDRKAVGSFLPGAFLVPHRPGGGLWGSPVAAVESYPRATPDGCHSSRSWYAGRPKRGYSGISGTVQTSDKGRSEAAANRPTSRTMAGNIEAAASKSWRSSATVVTPGRWYSASFRALRMGSRMVSSRLLSRDLTR